MWESDRERMVELQIAGRGIADARVLAAMRTVPRHLFVPPGTEAASIGAEARVLEIGTGCGYQAAVLGCLAAEVHSVEVRADLARTAAQRLRELGCDRVTVHVGDGYEGWREAAPFDAIVVTCAPERTPPQLILQLAPGGRMVIPIGLQGGVQSLVRYHKQWDGALKERELCPVRFVPLVRGRSSPK